MAEYIEREKVLHEMTSNPLPNDTQHLYLAMRNMVKKAPAADVVEVVRCKDCAFRGDMSDCECWHSPLGKAGLFTDDDFYCSCGERRSDNE